MKIIHIDGGLVPRELLHSTEHLVDYPFIESEKFQPKRLVFPQTEFAIWRVAKKLREKIPNIEQEYWRPEPEINEIFSKDIDGIKNVLFPSKYDIFNKIKSYAMIDQLKSMVGNEKFAVHFQGFPGGHNNFVFSSVKMDNLPVFATNNGSPFKSAFYNLSPHFTYNILSPFQKLYEQAIFFRKLKNEMDLIYVGAKPFQIDLVSGGYTKSSLFKDGIPLDEFQLKSRKKSKLRSKLNLPINKSIVLYVGRFDVRKGIKELLDFGNFLKKTTRNICLVCVGSSTSENSYYKQAKANGIIVRTEVSRKELSDYYYASDAFLIGVFGKPKNKIYGGIGSTTLESLLHGLPVVSTSLRHFSGTIEERKQLGIYTNNMLKKNPSNIELLKAVAYVINRKHMFRDSINIIKKYYDLELTNNIRVQDIQSLWREYYG